MLRLLAKTMLPVLMALGVVPSNAQSAVGNGAADCNFPSPDSATFSELPQPSPINKLPVSRLGGNSRRQSISSLTEDSLHLQQLLRVFNELKSRDIDPSKAGKMGLFAIAAGHGYPEGLAKELQDRLKVGKNSWQQCPHEVTTGSSIWVDDQTEAVLFLLWHRAYVMAFEATAQSVLASLKDPFAEQFRLPYWDWLRDSTVPEVFASPSATKFHGPIVNPLYRCRDTVLKDPTDSVLGDSINPFTEAAGMGLADFSAFFRNGWHDSVHFKSGRWMQESKTAAFDPLFWVHHSNVDRLFQVWLNEPGKPSNPDGIKYSGAWNAAIDSGRFSFLVEIDGNARLWKPKIDQLAFPQASVDCLANGSNANKTHRGIGGMRVGARAWEPECPTLPDPKPSPLKFFNDPRTVSVVQDKEYKSGCENGVKTLEFTEAFEINKSGVRIQLDLSPEELSRLRMWAKKSKYSEYESVFVSIDEAHRTSFSEWANNVHIFLSDEKNLPTYTASYVGSVPMFGMNSVSENTRSFPLSRNRVDAILHDNNFNGALTVYILPTFGQQWRFEEDIPPDTMLHLGRARFVVRGSVRAGGGSYPWCDEQ